MGGEVHWPGVDWRCVAILRVEVRRVEERAEHVGRRRAEGRAARTRDDETLCLQSEGKWRRRAGGGREGGSRRERGGRRVRERGEMRERERGRGKRRWGEREREKGRRREGGRGEGERGRKGEMGRDSVHKVTQLSFCISFCGAN